MKRLLLVLILLSVGGGNVLAMTSGAGKEKKVETEVGGKTEAMVVDVKEQEVVAVTDKKKPLCDITIDTSSPTAIFSSICAYTDSIVCKTAEAAAKVSILKQLGTDISAKGYKLNDVRDTYGRTALHVAAQLNDINVTCVLLIAGIPADSRDYQDCTALEIAAFFGSQGVMDFLADPTGNTKKHCGLILDFAA